MGGGTLQQYIEKHRKHASMIATTPTDGVGDHDDMSDGRSQSHLINTPKTPSSSSSSSPPPSTPPSSYHSPSPLLLRSVLWQCLCGLAALEAKRVVHRDVKVSGACIMCMDDQDERGYISVHAWCVHVCRSVSFMLLVMHQTDSPSVALRDVAPPHLSRHPPSLFPPPSTSPPVNHPTASQHPHLRHW